MPACATRSRPATSIVADESVRDRTRRRPVLAARRHLALPAAAAGRRAPSRKACKIEFELRYAFSNGALEIADQPGLRPHRQHLRRCVRASAPSRSMARAEAVAIARRSTVACSPRAGVVDEVALEVAGRVRRWPMRCTPAACCERHPRHRPGSQAVGIWGRLRPLDTAAARRRPGRGLPAAAGRPDGGAAARASASSRELLLAVRGDDVAGCA